MALSPPLLDTPPPALHAGGPPAVAGTSGDGRTDLLGRLRSPLSVRPSVDPTLAGGLRAWLEDGVSGSIVGAAATIEPGPDGALTLVTNAPPGEGRAASAGTGAPRRDAIDARSLRTTLLRAVFRLTVTSGAPRAPFEDALAALAVDDEAAVDAVRRLPRHRRTLLRDVVRHAAATITEQWRPPPPIWMPRTGERLVAPLAGGRVVLQCSTDLVLGGPSSGTASVCALRTHGANVPDDGGSRRLVALLETLRSGAAPFRVASYELDRGRLTMEDVTDELLSSAVEQVLALVARHADGTAGA